MKISDQKIEAIVETLRRYGARRIIVFGSYVSFPEDARDIDLGVEGIPPDRLGAAEMAVFRLLRMPFDLISREETPEFYKLVEKDSNSLYE